MNNDETVPAVAGPLDGPVRPAAWVIEYSGDERELYFERRPYGLSQHPLYDQAAINAAVAAERERCAKICEGLAPAPESYFEIAERLRECAAEIRMA